MTKKKDPYQITEWKGLPNYECNLCPFSSLDPRFLEKHFQLRHKMAVQVKEPPPVEPPQTSQENDES